MLKKLYVVVLGTAVCLMTASAVSAQSTAQQAQDKTKAAAHKTAEVATDAEITSAVKAKLLADKTVGGMSIEVDTDNGVVTLTGDVKNTAEKNQAIHLARDTKGVKRVVNKLTMETAGTSGKKDIGDKTKDAADKTKDGAVK